MKWTVLSQIRSLRPVTTLKIAALAAATALTVAAPAAAAPKKAPATAPSAKKAPAKKYAAAIADCVADGDLDKVYSPGHLKNALRKMPTDVATYTACNDVLRFARSTGPVIPVNKTTARVKMRCVGSRSYEVTLSVGSRTLGTATVPKCKSGRTKVVRVPVTQTLARKARIKKQLVTIVANVGDLEIQYVARLTGHRA